eukprot:3184464-Pyramimonas_sp.AAC.1
MSLTPEAATAARGDPRRGAQRPELRSYDGDDDVDDDDDDEDEDEDDDDDDDDFFSLGIRTNKKRAFGMSSENMVRRRE